MKLQIIFGGYNFPIKSTNVRCFALSFVDNNILTTLEIVAKEE